MQKRKRVKNQINELMRHIRPNPVRAGVVNSLSELDRYGWSDTVF
jgi:hypothetical protein